MFIRRGVRMIERRYAVDEEGRVSGCDQDYEMLWLIVAVDSHSSAIYGG